MDTPVTSSFEACPPESLEAPPGTIDAHSVTSTFGAAIERFRGGLGEVLVVVDEQLGRRVAVKQLQSRWQGNYRALRAFKQEAELTSRLEHPGIVPVHGVGVTPDGRPCYTMRFVEGVTLAQKIAALRAEPRDFSQNYQPLLRSFIAVCNTVAFAHSRGIIHRDLKPENVMLGAFGETLVIDWGLAEDVTQASALRKEYPFAPPAADQPLVDTGIEGDTEATAEASNLFTRRSLRTVDGDIMGTPAYLSPEQASGEQDAIGTKTDIFGLGSILYVILTGVPPFQASSAARSLALAADYQWLAPRQRDRSIPMGLDAICRRAMAQQPDDRYVTADALAREVENWLCGEPIDTISDPWNRRLSRFIRKHRSLAGMLASVLVVLVIAIPLTIVLINRERLRRQSADRIATIRADSTQQVTEYLAKIFRTVDPSHRDDPGFVGAENFDAQKTFRRMLEVGYDLVGKELVEQPALHAQLLRSIGDSFRGLGDFDRAAAALHESLVLNQQLGRESTAEILACEYSLAVLAYDLAHYEEAESRLRRVIAGRQRLSPPQPLLVAEAQCQLAWVLFYQPLGLANPQASRSTVEESIALFTEVIETRQEHLPANDRSLGLAYAGLAAAAACSSQHASQAAIASAAALEIFTSTDQESSLGNTLLEYRRAETLRAQGNGPDAEKIYLELKEQIARHLGTQHPIYVIHLWNMAGHYRKFGQLSAAQRLIEELRTIARRIPSLRSSPAHVDGLIQYALGLQQDDVDLCREVYQEAMQFALERPQDNRANLERLQLLGKTLEIVPQ